MNKSEINVSLVRRLIATQFPQWAHLPIEPVQLSGWDNRTFRLGDEMTVRLPSAEGYAAQVEKEQFWLPTLAPLLPLSIPAPLAKGKPDESYPWHWSVYGWLRGENATLDGITHLPEFAASLAQFLVALQKIEAQEGPPPGEHNWFRGAPPAVYNAETRNALLALKGELDTDTATAVWETALASTWRRPPVWIHGDVAAGNLLIDGGKLCAVIDFGCSGVGDPACDLVIAWTFLHGESRDVFRKTLALDPATWARGRGWALWKGLITLVQHLHTNPALAEISRNTLEAVLDDFRNHPS